MSVAETISDGSLVLAVPVALAAGFVSFLSPCVLPLVPGYVSYVTGMTGAELQQGPSPRRIPTVLLGALLFVLGFTVVFVSYGALFGALGGWLLTYQDAISRVLGVVVIVLGLSFMGLGLPFLQREARWHQKPERGLWGAPLLGALFGLGWTPCIGPALAAIQSLAFSEASALRGALLSVAYCIGLGLPFVLVALLFHRAVGTLAWFRRHTVAIMRIGGAMMVAIGVLLLTGLWTDLTVWLRAWVGAYEVPL